MIVLSTVSTVAASSPRASSSFSSSSKVFAVSLRLARPRRFACPCFFAMAELVKDKEASAAAASASSSAVAPSSDAERKRSRVFLDATTEGGMDSVLVVWFARKCGLWIGD